MGLMSKMYAIQWKSKANGRSGRGTRLFERQEAEQLVANLNRQYPQIDHELCEVETPADASPEASAMPTPPVGEPAA